MIETTLLAVGHLGDREHGAMGVLWGLIQRHQATKDQLPIDIRRTAEARHSVANSARSGNRNDLRISVRWLRQHFGILARLLPISSQN